jgi:hypothetical protein
MKIADAGTGTTQIGTSDRLEVIRTVADLEGLRRFWQSRATDRDGDLDFYLFIIGASPEAARPHVLIVRRDGKPDAMLIGRLENRRIQIGSPYIGLQSPILRILTFIDGGVLDGISASDSDLFARAILSSLRAGEADVAVLERLRTDYPLYQHTRSLADGLCVDPFPVRLTHRVRRLDDGPFLASLSANERYNQQRRSRRLAAGFSGNIRLECFHDAAEIDRLMSHAEEIARRSYQRGLGVGFFATANMRRRLILEANRGSLRAHILYAGDHPCAFWIASLFAGVLYNDFMAYDPSYAKYAPGMYVVMQVIEEVSRDRSESGGARVIDFGTGDAEWKVRLGNEAWEEASVFIFAPRLKALSVNAMRTLAAIIEASTRSVLQRTSLLPRLKRFWRQQKAPNETGSHG